MSSDQFLEHTEQLYQQFVHDTEQRGLTRGREQGLAPLMRQFTRRVGRPLTDAEHDALTTRLDTLGPDRLGDVVLDFAPDALSAWLANPAAT